MIKPLTYATFPLRFAGSKTFSLPGLITRFFTVGIQYILKKNDPNISFRDALLCDKGFRWFQHKNLSAEEAKQHLLYATAAGSVQKNHPAWMEVFGYTPINTALFDSSLEKDGPILFDRTTGLKLMAYQKGDEVLIVFGALDSHLTQFNKNEYPEARKLKMKILGDCTFSMVGGCPSLYMAADSAVKKMMESQFLKNKKVTLCGSSLGGSLASYVSLKQQIPAVALNPFALGPGLQKDIGNAKLQKADEVLTTVRVKGDFCCDLPWIIKVMDLALNLLGIKTQGVFGSLYNVPSIHMHPGTSHQDSYGALVAKWKPEWKELCKSRFSSDRTTAHEQFKKLVQLVEREFTCQLRPA